MRAGASARGARAILEFGDWLAVCFSAPLVELTQEPLAGIAHLGPDILAADVSWVEIMRRARALGPVSLGELLLDQRVCCGIGNVYKCEALWTLGVDPWLLSDALTDESLTQLFATARHAMQANLSGGFERRFESGRPRAVHGRRGRPCPRCGTTVAARLQGEQARWTYFCPTCQRTGASAS